MKISFLIIAYNAASTISNLFEDLLKQDYPHDLIEVILVDGNSTDKTKYIMEQFRRKNDNKFCRVIVQDNPKRTLPCGWNVALAHVSGDIIIKVDAHASIPIDFLSNNVKCIESGEKICGGKRPNIIDEESNWKRTLLIAETSMFGSSIASYRRSSEKKYVNSLFHAAYSKEVFENVGFFNENLARTEDNEIHYRMRKAGYRFYFDPKIISYQHTRNSLTKMVKQKYLNGYWIGLTLSDTPQCLSIFHVVPFIFVGSIIFSLFLMLLKSSILFWLICCSYLFVALIMTLSILIKEKFSPYLLLLPFLFLILHLSYGIGTLIGIFSIPKFLKNKKGREYE